MKNININFGGLIGAIAGLAVVIWLAMTITGNAEKAGKIGIAGLIGGALAGNRLWDICFAKKKE